MLNQHTFTWILHTTPFDTAIFLFFKYKLYGYGVPSKGAHVYIPLYIIYHVKKKKNEILNMLI